MVDAGGHLIALKREDNAPLIRPDLAAAKAWTSAAFGASTAEMEERAKQRPWFIGALADMPSGKIVPLAWLCGVEQGRPGVRCSGRL